MDDEMFIQSLISISPFQSYHPKRFVEVSIMTPGVLKAGRPKLGIG
jgi:hypothetical protein